MNAWKMHDPIACTSLLQAPAKSHLPYNPLDLHPFQDPKPKQAD